VVCLTDLPIFHYRDIVAADINEDKGIILLSIPAFGWGSLLKNIKNAIIYTFKEIDNQEFRTKRSEEHTSELQSRFDLVCRLLLELCTTGYYFLSLHDALPICCLFN